jgi:hypothetical protein
MTGGAGRRSNGRGLALLLSCLLIGPGLSHAQSPEHLEVGAFSSARPSGKLPAEWRPLTFSRITRHSVYSLVEEGGTVVVKATSRQAASGLTRVVSIDPAEYPVIEWRWKVNNLLQKGDVTRKEGDDYPARVYITFAFDPDSSGLLARLKQQAARLVHGEAVPYRAISYIWGSNSPAGTMVANPYTDQVMMFVVEGGSKRLRQWVTERRNVYDDYRQAFGEPPSTITGVAIMTDTDNTQETAVTWYGDIIFKKSRGTGSDRAVSR